MTTPTTATTPLGTTTIAATPTGTSTQFVRLTGSTLRDESHAVRHQFTEDDVVQVADARGCRRPPRDRSDARGRALGVVLQLWIWCAHRRSAGRGGRQNRQTGEDCRAGAARSRHGRRSACSARCRRAGRQVATHCTEADVSVQHFGAARELGMETVSFLMLSRRMSPLLATTFELLGVPTGFGVDLALAAVLHAERTADRYGVSGARDPASGRRGGLRRRAGRHDHRRRHRTGPPTSKCPVLAWPVIPTKLPR